MAPKKKPSEVGGPSACHPPPPEPTVGGGDAVGRVVAGEDTHGATRSKNRTDDRTSVSVDAPRPSQHTTTQQRHTTGGGIHLLGQGQTGGSRDAPDPRPGTSKAKAPARDPAPSNVVRSPSVSRSSHRSPAFPSTPAEALARAQLLLDFPPAADKAEEWRATIRSLIDFANNDSPQQPSTSRPRQAEKTKPDGDKTAGGATSVHSPPQKQKTPPRRNNADDGSTASSDPRARRDQRQVLDDRRQEDARTTIERRREARRQSDQRAGDAVDARAPGEPGDLPYAAGCPAFTRELRRVQWPSMKNFKPDVPEKYDGKTHPSEFLSVYTIAVQAAGGRDEKILANYFPLVLKPNVRSSWADLCHQFVGAFTGVHKPHGQESDLHILAQKEGESLRKYIQRFSRVQHNIPDVHPAAVISAFHQNVRNRRMREEMAMTKIRDVSELYALADKCARAEEGRKLPGEDAGAGGSDSDDAAPAKKSRRRNNRKKGKKEVLAVEKSGKEAPAKQAQAGGSGKEPAPAAAADKPGSSDKQYCKIHRTKGHDLSNCKRVEYLVEQQKAEYERRDKEKAQGGGEEPSKKRPFNGRGGRRGKAKQRQGDRPPRGRDNDEDDDEDMEDDENSEQEFQKATEVLCVDGDASLHTSHRQLKQWVREVNAAEPPVESRRLLKWSSTPIVFDLEDHPDRTTAVGCLPMLVSPTIRNLKVTKMLVDGGAGLNLISSAVIKKLQIPDGELKETGSFQGINPGRSKPNGKITLPGTFGGELNFRTERITLDVADIPLPYNGILGCPALAKFMAASHYAYNMLKIPGPIGVISVPGDKKDALICADKIYRDAAAAADSKTLAAEAPGGKTKTKPGKSSGQTHLF